jgi:hypothetical protein
MYFSWTCLVSDYDCQRVFSYLGVVLEMFNVYTFLLLFFTKVVLSFENNCFLLVIVDY